MSKKSQKAQHFKEESDDEEYRIIKAPFNNRQPHPSGGDRCVENKENDSRNRYEGN